MLGDERDSTFRLLAHLDVPLAAAMHGPTRSIAVFTIAILVPCHTTYTYHRFQMSNHRLRLFFSKRIIGRNKQFMDHDYLISSLKRFYFQTIFHENYFNYLK